MSCEPIRSGLFYLAEDDPDAIAELNAHLAVCTDCLKEWQEYRATLDFYQAASATSTPALRTRTIHWNWRVGRVAAVLVLGTLITFLLPHQTQQTSPMIKSAVHSWEPPVIATPSVTLDSRDLDFSTRVETLRNSIARLQSQTSANKF